MQKRLALYPGTFDPFTLGHLDVLERACRIFDEIEVTIAVNESKQTLFTTDERIDMIRACTRHLDTVSVAAFDGLLVDHARERGAAALVRGLRQVGDFDYEFRMAFANRKLYPDVETVLFMTGEAHAFVSATIVREVFFCGGDVSVFVPPPVMEAFDLKKNKRKVDE